MDRVWRATVHEVTKSPTQLTPMHREQDPVGHSA